MKMKSNLCKSQIRRAGFGLVELLISISISSLVILGTVGVFKQLNQSRENASNEMNRLASESLGGLQIYMDLLAADVFNLNESKVCETSGNSLSEVKLKEASEFFIHNPSATNCDLANPGPSCKREKKITLGNPGDQIVLTLVRKVAGGGAKNAILPGTRTLRPTILFDDSPPTSDIFRSSGALSFDPQRQLKSTLKAYGMGNSGMVIRMLSPFETRAYASTGSGYDFDVAPRYPSITMTIDNSGNVVPVTIPGSPCQPRWGFQSAAGANELVDSSNPGVGGNKIEAFFRLLNPDAGFNTWVKVSLIEVVAYKLVEEFMGGRKVGRLTRSIWNPRSGAFENPRNIIDGIASFSLKRPNIRTPSLVYDVERQRK